MVTRRLLLFGLLLLFLGSAYALDLNYWIEPDASGNPSKVWVKVPEIPANGTAKIYVRKEAGYSPNGKSVFEVYDDFDVDTIGTDWISIGSGSWKIENGILKGGAASNTGEVIKYAKKTFSTTSGYYFESRFQHATYTTGNDVLFSRFYDSTDNYTNFFVYYHWKNASPPYLGRGGNPAIVCGSGSNLAGQTWYRFKVYTWGTHYKIEVYDDNGNLLCSSTDSSQTVLNQTMYFAFGGYGTDPWFDYILIAKYANPEPTITVNDLGWYYEITIKNNTSTDLTDFQVSIPASELGVTSTTESLHFSDQPLSGLAVSISYSPTDENALILDPENNITSITGEYNAVFSKSNVTVTYYRAFDGDSNTTIIEGNEDVNYITFSRTYDSIGDYNTCVYVRAVDAQNNEYEDTACDVVHIDEYPQALDFDWNNHIPFVGETIEFNGEATDNGTLTYSWDFGDPATGCGQTVQHAYSSAGTYTVTMTACDDLNLCKSVSKSVAVYAEPELNWTPATPHAQEPTTFTIVHDPRLQVLDTNWEFTDANVSGETNTTATVRFQHYGAGKAVSTTFVLTDGTNERNSSVSGTVDVDPITWTITLKDEATDSDFNLSKVDSVAVSLLDGTDEMARDTYTAVSKTYEFNNFPTDISAYVTAGTVSYYRTVHVLNPDYEMNIPIYLADPTQSPLVQLVFVPSSKNVTVVIQRSGKYIHGAVPDITGTVVAYLVRDVPYTVGYACEDGEVHLIGTYTPITATTIKLTTLCGTVSPLPSKMFAGINFDAYYDANTNSIVVEYSDDTQKTKSVCVDIAGDENAQYHECSSGNVVKFTYILPQEYNKASFYVKLAVQHEEYGSFTLTKWVGIGYNIVVPGLPDWAYPWLVLIPALFIILGATAIKSRLAPVVGVGWVALGQYAGWVSLPLGGALISFMLFLLAITWRSEG